MHSHSAYSDSPAGAAKAFVEGLQRDIAFTAHAKVVPSGYPRALKLDAEYSVSLNGGQPVGISSSGPARMLSMDMTYSVRPRPEGDWEAFPTAYSFGAFDRDLADLVLYHWHPWMDGAAFPHLHLGSTLCDRLLVPAHIPTGGVTFGEFLAFLIKHLGVRTLRGTWRDLMG